MGDSTCVMHPLSYTSTFSNDTQEGNPLCAMGESVSLGRYMSENLEWEKWSSFNYNKNRYVEEAKSYSQPGSVKEKKAYFEAHFKRMAALKAAALLDQENATQSCSEGAENLRSNSEMGVSEEKRVGNESENGEFVVYQNDLYSNCDKEEYGDANIKGDDQVNEFKDGEKGKESSENEVMGNMTQLEKPPLQEISNLREGVPVIKKNPPLSSYMSSVDARTTPVESSSPVKSAKKEASVDDPDKRRTPLRMSINRELNKLISPVIRKIGGSSKASKHCSTPLRTPSKAPLDGASDTPSATPKSAKSRVRRRLDSSLFGNKVTRPSGSRSPSVSRNKISSPMIPTSFCMSTNDRASRRKQKLEEKFNAKATEKMQQQPKFKEKAEAEFTKLRHSFCFKAMPSPEHYLQKETSSSFKHTNELTNFQSSRQERKNSTSTSQNTKSLPPRKPAIKSTESKHIQQTNGHLQTRSSSKPT